MSQASSHQFNLSCRVLGSLLTSTAVLVAGSTCTEAQAQQPGIAWSVSSDGQTTLGLKPAVAPGGSVYTGNGGTLTAVAPNGLVQWTDPAGRGQISVGADGTVYGSSGSTVRALNPDGSLLWSYSAEFTIVAGPAVGPDGNIYFVENAKHGGRGLLSLSPAGDVRWVEPGDPALVDHDGLPHVIEFADNRVMLAMRTARAAPATFWAFDFDGNQAFALDSGCDGQPAINPLTGHLVTGNGNCQEVRTYDIETGALLWAADAPSNTTCDGLANITAGPDGSIYTALCYRAFWSLEASGDERWFDDDFDFYFQMDRLGVAPDNSVLLSLGRDFTDSAGRVRAFSTLDSSLSWELTLPDAGAGASSAPVFDPIRNRAYFNAQNPGLSISYLYAVDLDARAHALSVSNLIGGESAQFVVRDASLQRTQFIAYSLQGLGATFVPPLNVTLDLESPKLLASGSADAGGTFEASVRVPIAARGQQVYFQAAELNSTTNVIVELVQ